MIEGRERDRKTFVGTGLKRNRGNCADFEHHKRNVDKLWIACGEGVERVGRDGMGCDPTLGHGAGVHEI